MYDTGMEAFAASTQVRKAQRPIANILAWLAFALAFVASAGLLFAPTGTSIEGAAVAPGPAAVPHVTRPTILQANGWLVLIPLALPVLIAGLAAILSARWTRIVAATLIGLFVFVAAASIGLFYLPASLLLLLAAVGPWSRAPAAVSSGAIDGVTT